MKNLEKKQPLNISKLGEVKEITYKKFAEDIKAMAEALISINANRIAVIGNNRYEWCVTYLGTETAGKVIVPLDKALTDIVKQMQLYTKKNILML